jgi:hypothetical protein
MLNRHEVSVRVSGTHVQINLGKTRELHVYLTEMEHEKGALTVEDALEARANAVRQDADAALRRAAPRRAELMEAAGRKLRAEATQKRLANARAEQARAEALAEEAGRAEETKAEDRKRRPTVDLDANPDAILTAETVASLYGIAPRTLRDK